MQAEKCNDRSPSCMIVYLNEIWTAIVAAEIHQNHDFL
nr:MAG TPA: hypothetical protein [Caudoviricetes sp.]